MSERLPLPSEEWFPGHEPPTDNLPKVFRGIANRAFGFVVDVFSLKGFGEWCGFATGKLTLWRGFVDTPALRKTLRKRFRRGVEGALEG